MFAKFINIHKEEPYYKFCEDDNINGIMSLMMKNKIDFPETSAGFSKLIEIYTEDRANNVSDEDKLKHICHFLRVPFPILDPSIDNTSSTETSAEGDGYETALETNDNPPEPSEEIDDVNATPRAGTPIAPHEDGPIDPFDEPVSLGNEEIETIQAHLAAHSEAKKPDNLRTRKRTHADVSVSPDSDDNTQVDSDVSVLSLGKVIDSMSLEQDGGHGLITPSFQNPVAPSISNTSGNRSRRPVPLPRRVMLNAPSTVAQPLASEPKRVESPTIEKPSSEISNGSGIAPVLNGNVSTPKPVAATNEIHKTPSKPGMTAPMSANTSIASSSSTRGTRFTGPAADEKLRRQREEAEKQLQKI
jgi:hypothetical protein